MMKRLHIILAIYLAVFIFTFGNIAARNDAKEGSLAVLAGFYGALVWPVYWPLWWSWEIQSTTPDHTNEVTHG